MLDMYIIAMYSIGMGTLNSVPATGIIWRLSLKWRAAIDRELADLPLTHAQYAVLAPLFSLTSDDARPSQRELADVIGLDALYVSKLVRTLERVGYVQRADDPRDARALKIALTPLGRQVTATAISLVMGIQDRLAASLGGAASERMRNFVDAARLLLTENATHASDNMKPPQVLTAQQIGRAENALRAILNRLLAESGMEYVAWVIVNLVANSGPSNDFEQFVGRAVNTLKSPAEQVRATVEVLLGQGLLEANQGRLGLTTGGEALYRRLRDGIAEITDRLYASIPTSDLQTAQRVLEIITEQANTELIN